MACGFAAVADVDSKRLDDRMDSYFFAETLKYFYLLQEDDERPSLPLDRYVFNTEAHPFSVVK